MMKFPIPDHLHGDALAAELAAAGISDPSVFVHGDQLVVDVDESQRATVERVVANHVPPPPPPDTDAEFRAAIEAATSIADLKAALLGTNGPGAEPRRPA